jgi:hypothetical protein
VGGELVEEVLEVVGELEQREVEDVGSVLKDGHVVGEVVERWFDFGDPRGEAWGGVEGHGGWSGGDAGAAAVFGSAVKGGARFRGGTLAEGAEGEEGKGGEGAVEAAAEVAGDGVHGVGHAGAQAGEVWAKDEV